LRDRVLDIRCLDSQLHVARNERRPDEWDPPIEPASASHLQLRSGGLKEARVSRACWCAMIAFQSLPPSIEPPF
jgi:hypothetical protein